MSSVRIVHPHHTTAFDYHEWYPTGDRVRANKRGIPNRRMYSASWFVWQCNNTECGAYALVPIDAVVRLIEAASNDR